MAQTIAASLTLDSSQAQQNADKFAGSINNADTSVKNLKQEIKDATLALQSAQKNFGDYSKEALTAAKSLAELRDRQKEATETAGLFDPGAKFQAFGNVVRTVSGGFTALTGTMALFGAESEDVQKTLVKLQAALAVTEGINTIADSAKDFERLGSVIKSTTAYQTLYNFVINGTTKATQAQTIAQDALVVSEEAGAAAAGEQAAAQEAQTVATVTTTAATGGLITAMGILRLALIATGIGAIVVLLVAAYQAMSKLASAAEDAAAKQKELNEQTIKYADVGLKANQEAAKRATELDVARAKARGATENEIETIQRDGLLRQAKALQAHYNEIKGIDEKAAQDDLDALKDLQQQSDLLHADHDQRDLEKSRQTAKERLEIALQESKDKEALDKNNATLANAREDDLTQISYNAQRHRIDLLGQYAASVKGIDDEAYKQAIRDKKAAETELTKIQSDEAVKRYNDLKALNEKIRKEGYGTVLGAGDITDINQENASLNNPVPGQLTGGIGQTGANQKIAEQQQAVKDAKDKAASVTPQSGIASDIVNYTDELKQLDDYYNQRLALVERGSAEETQILEAKAAAQKQLQLTTAADVLTNLSTVIGKQTAVGKAAAVAATTISTYQAAMNSYNSLSGIPIVGPALGAVAAALAIAVGIANVKKILAVQTPGGASAGSTPNLSPSAPITPVVAPTASNTKINQDQVNQMGNATVRAYVVESDVTDNQEKIQRLNRAARLGG